jgi:hypothetical protein
MAGGTRVGFLDAAVKEPTADLGLLRVEQHAAAPPTTTACCAAPRPGSRSR